MWDRNGLGIVIGAVAAVVCVSSLQAATPTAKTIAAAITVRIDGRQSGGSGFMMDRRGDWYFVLTNAHVVNSPGDYTIQTPDGQSYPVSSSQIRFVPSLDLAVLSFRSNTNYRVAQFGNSDRVQPGQTVYVAGWPLSGGSLRQRIFVSTEGKLTQTGPNFPKTALRYTNIVRVGMSGGPVLNAEGQAIAINRLVQLIDRSDTIVGSGIPINAFLAWWKTVPLPTPTKPGSSASPTVAPGAGFMTLAQSLPGKASVNAVAIATLDNTPLVASGNSDGTLSLWNLSTHQLIQTWKAHSQIINTIAFSRDGKILASGSEDQTIKLWDVKTGKLIRTLTGHQDSVSSLAFNPQNSLLVSGSWDRTIKVWDSTTGKIIKTLTGHKGLISAVTISSDGKLLASGSQDKTIKLWNLSNFQTIRTLTGHQLSILSLAISKDNQLIASGSGDSTIRLWTVNSGQLKNTLKGHTDGVWSVAFSPDRKTLISGSWDKTIKIWDVNSATLKTTLNQHSDYVVSIAFSADGRTIATGSWDKQVKIWRIN